MQTQQVLCLPTFVSRVGSLLEILTASALARSSSDIFLPPLSISCNSPNSSSSSKPASSLSSSSSSSCSSRNSLYSVQASFSTSP